MQGEQDHTPTAYRVRTAEPSDDAALRAEIGATLAHPDNQGKRESYRGAAGRGDLLVLERYDRQGHAWHVAGFVECHMRVDEYLSIRDVGTHGDEPQGAVVRYLLEQAFDSFRPVAAQVKLRRDARAWLDIFRGIPGWFLEGEEYRRPHYWTIWRWDREHVQAAEQASRGPERGAARGPRPPQPRPPARTAQPAARRPGPAAPGTGPTGNRPIGNRPAGAGPTGNRPPGPRPAGPRPAGPASFGPRPAGSGPRPAATGPRPGGPRPAQGQGGPPTPRPPQRGPAPDGARPPSNPARDGRRPQPPRGPRPPQRRPGPARPR